MASRVMHQDSGPVKIREARQSDKARVLEFSTNTWPGGDYIPEVWDDWLEDKKGRLLVATVKEVPIGVAHAFFQTRDIAWLEGVRVHPSYRGRGIAGILNIALTRFAAKKKARVARLSTASRNRASQRHLAKVGFRLLEKFLRLDSERPMTRRPPGVTRPLKLSSSVWRWVRARPEFEQFKGLYSDGWTWYPLNYRSLRKFLNRQGILLTGSTNPSSCSLFSVEPRKITVGFAAGAVDEVNGSAKFLRYLLSRDNLDKVRVLLPQESKLVGAFEAAGFEKSGKVLVYEKELRESGSKSNKQKAAIGLNSVEHY